MSQDLEKLKNQAEVNRVKLHDYQQEIIDSIMYGQKTEDAEFEIIEEPLDIFTSQIY